MAKSNKVLIAAGTIGTAAAVGFLMQTGKQDVAQPMRAPEPVQSVVLSGDHSQPDVAPLDVSGITLISSADQPEPARVVPPAAKEVPKLARMTAALPDVLPDAPRLNETCPLTMTAEPTIAAMVNLHFLSKCDPYTRVTIHHAGVSFSEMTDSLGSLDITVPALSEEARFTAEIPAGGAAVAITRVSSVAFYDRAIVEGVGHSGVSLHALEFDADYASGGHVSMANPRDPMVASRGEGGFMVTLGDPALSEGRVAQVYTFPTGTARLAGDVRLSVEVEVLETTCGRDVRAKVLQVREGIHRAAQDIDITMPGCDAVGDFLLLKTPLDDLTIAMK